MNKTVIRFSRGGGMRVVVGDGTAPTDLMKQGCPPPKRASRIEPIQAGPSAGFFSVDMSPMGEDWLYCLWPPQFNRQQALQQEHEHLVQRWIKT